jgi:very-short-patch-repair endonuclease
MSRGATQKIEVRSPQIGSLDPDGTESPIERLLFAELKRRRMELPEFVLQYRIKNSAGLIVSRADFAFVAEKICIFCDGARYHLEKNQWQRDLRQRRELDRLGWRCQVFTGAEIMADDARTCVQEIIDAIRS